MRKILAVAVLTASLWPSKPAWSQAVVHENLETVTLYVDGSTGSDSNPGTQLLPYKTISAAASKALSNKEISVGTKVIINPGTYRESIKLTGNRKQSNLPVTLQAATNGTVYVTGSVQYTGWSTYSGNSSIYMKTWPYKWGACPIDTGGPPYEQPVVLRSEMIFVNDAMMTQVMSLSQMLFPGTFYVDEERGQVYLWPPIGTNMNSADVEVATESPVLFVNGQGGLTIDGIVIRGMVFEHANTCHTDGAVQVRGSATNILFDSDSFSWNNGSGSHFNGPASAITVMNTIANHNGASGFNTYQIKNILWDHDTASYNNWRGAQGAFYEWGAAGAHLFSDHGETFTSFTSTFNETHSIHWDTDSQNISVTGLLSAQNMFGALFEKNGGPLTYAGSYFCNTQVPTSTYGSGFLLRDSMYTTLSGNTFFDNTVSQVEVIGLPGGFTVTNWETNETYQATNKFFTMKNNAIQGVAGQQLFKDASLSGADWTGFVTTLSSNNNTWWNGDSTMAFTVPTPKAGTVEDFGEWQTTTGQDSASSWSKPAIDPTAKCTVTADQPDFWLVADNDIVSTNAAGNALFNLTTLALGGMTGTVKLAVDGISAIPGASVTLTPSTTTTAGGSVLKFNVPASTPPGTYPFTVLANTGSVTRMISMSAKVPVSSVRLSTDQLTFDDQPVNTMSPGQTITLTNTGTRALSITSIDPTTAYTENDTCGGSVPAGKSCTITIVFYPRQLITYSGNLTITDSDDTGTQLVTLTGTTVGSAGTSFSPRRLSFGPEKFMQPSQPQTITLTNNGTATLNVSGVQITGEANGDYLQTNTCHSVPQSGNCAIVVTFKPTQTGSRSASVSVTDDAIGSPQTVSLSGTGEIALSISPKTLGFGTIKIGKSATKTATMTNVSSAPVNIQNFTITGPDSADFTETNSCEAQIAGNSTCTITIVYSPQGTGTRTGTLSANDSDPQSPQTVSLTGTGGAVPDVTLTPSSLTFSGEVYKSESPAQTVTIANNGTSTLTITKYSFTGMNGGDFKQTNNCNGSVPTGKTCVVSVTFTPTGLGSRTATLNVNDNALDSPQTVSLTGTGLTALTISPASVDYGSVPTGGSSAQTVTITNASTSSINFTSATLSGPNAGDFSQKNSCGPRIQPTSSCTVTVTFKPLALGSRSATLILTDVDPTGPQMVPLTGTGGAQASVTFSPASLSFGNQVYEKPSGPLTTTMTNTSSSAMSITKITITGTSRSDYLESDNCGTSLAAGASCGITVTFTPGSIGNRNATLNVTDTGIGSPQTVALSGTGVTAITVSPLSLTYGTVSVSGTSSLPVTVTNASTAAITVSNIVLGGTNASNFSQTNTCGSSIPGNSSCTITVTFKPLSAGTKSGTLTVRDSDPSAPQIVTLTGTGSDAGPGVLFSPDSLAFGNVIFKNSSAPMATVLTNNGTASLTINSITITGAKTDFVQTSNCGTSLATGASCTINVTFTPSSTGSRTASISVADNASGSPQTVSLSGTGVTALTLSPSSVSFGTVTVGTTNTQNLTITNASSAAINITSLTLGGTNAGDFSQTNTCGTKIAGNSNCSVSVSFSPATAGSRRATLTIADSDPSSPQTVSLTGTGTGASSVTFSPATLTFGVQPYEKPSAAMATTMTNTGTAPLTITSVTIMGANTADFSKLTTCGTTLASGASCTITVTFIPTGIGARTANVSISDNVTGSPQSVPLSGTGISALSLTPTALNFGAINLGGMTTLQTTITNASTASIGVTNMTLGGSNPGDFSQTNTCGARISGNGSCTITVTFKPLSIGARSASLQIGDNDPSSPQTLTLSGTGSTPGIAFVPALLNFLSQGLNMPSNPLTSIITNTGTGLLTISNIVVSGANRSEFAETTNCLTTLVPGESCNINVVFTPVGLGTRTAAIAITDNVPGGPQTIPLQGSGSALNLSPNNINFGGVNVGTSDTLVVTMTNVTTAAVLLKDHLFIGANPDDFAEMSDCGQSLAAKSNCTITVMFTPQAAGARSAQLKIDDNDISSPHLVLIAGLGK